MSLEQSWLGGGPDSPSQIKKILAANNIAARKRWGQNFLIDLATQKNIIKATGLSELNSASVWEIGPGLGVLTRVLTTMVGSLTLFEIDPAFCRYLEDKLRGQEHTSLVAGDFLKTWSASLEKTGIPDLVIGNLPYNIASAILGQFAEQDMRPSKMLFTVQKEMADRITAKARTKPYSSFSLCCQSQFSIRVVSSLSPTVFYPQPNVRSQIIELRPRRNPLSQEQKILFFVLIRELFRNRRKTLRNNIKNSSFQGQEQVFIKLGIDLQARAEELSLLQYYELAANLSPNYQPQIQRHL